MGHQSVHIQILAAIGETILSVRWVMNASVNVSEGTVKALNEVLWSSNNRNHIRSKPD